MGAGLIQFFMVLRNATKLYHWNTQSYARHKATDQFIDKLDDLSDKFIEVYIGRYGRPESLGKDTTLKLPALNEKYIVEYFEEARDWLTDKLPTHISPKDTELINIRDEMIGEINQTLYLFTLE